jgi:hypothetical protein
MLRLATSLVLGLAAGISTGQLCAQSTVPITLVKAGRLLDSRTGNVLAPAAVLVEGNKIKQVGLPSQISVPGGAKVIDLGDATLLPGLIDGYTHLFLDIIVPPELEIDLRLEHHNLDRSKSVGRDATTFEFNSLPAGSASLYGQPRKLSFQSVR